MKQKSVQYLQYKTRLWLHLLNAVKTLTRLERVFGLAGADFSPVGQAGAFFRLGRLQCVRSHDRIALPADVFLTAATRIYSLVHVLVTVCCDERASLKNIFFLRF